jgi:hypothetical protein
VARITVYLEDNIAEKLRSLAESSGVSVSNLVADLIHTKIANKWPESITQLAGAWPDFPSLNEIRQEDPKDAPRESP